MADVPAPPPWPHVLVPARVMGEARGLRVHRAIIHAHSVHSHDACDGNPYVDGGVNEPCLQSFRRSVCADKIDVVFLTEHSGHMSEGSFERVMQVRPGDEPLMEDGALVGYRIACPDGHRTMLLPGAENGLMPLGLRRHPDLVDGSLDRAYDATDLAALQRFRAAGALVAIPHVEQSSIEWLRERQPDVLEIYNVHANIDPRIALVHLGYNPGPALVDLLRFRSLPGVDPDMAFLTFFQESGNDLQKWATLLAEGSHIPGVAASDAHENAIPALLSDGERGDSYRRVFRWFSNELLVRGELTRASAMDALREGRVFVAFEAFGTPVGFAFTARAGATVSDIGARVTLASAPTLEVMAPAVNELHAELPRPTVRVRILRAERDGRWTEVAAGTRARELHAHAGRGLPRRGADHAAAHPPVPPGARAPRARGALGVHQRDLRGVIARRARERQRRQGGHHLEGRRAIAQELLGQPIDPVEHVAQRREELPHGLIAEVGV